MLVDQVCESPSQIRQWLTFGLLLQRAGQLGIAARLPCPNRASISMLMIDIPTAKSCCQESAKNESNQRKRSPYKFTPRMGS